MSESIYAGGEGVNAGAFARMASHKLAEFDNFCLLGRNGRSFILEGAAFSFPCEPRSTRPSSKLPNYLRAHRRRAGFSQDEAAFLLGARSGAKICRLEKFRRQPTLRTALLCDAIFRVPVRELFAGHYEQAERQVRQRACFLARRLDNAAQDRRTAQKMEALTRIIAASPTP